MRLTAGSLTTKLGLLLIPGLAAVVATAQNQTELDIAGQQIVVRATGVIVGPKDEPFSMPSDVAVGREGNVYVLDGVNHRVVVFNATGEYCFQFGSQGSNLGQMFFPLGITTAPDGKVYIADSGNHRFQVFLPDGKAIKAVPLPVSTSGVPPDPTDVKVDMVRGHLYIVDNDNHVIHVYSLANDNFEQVWGGPGQGRRQFRYPFFIDTSSQGYVLVVEPINTRVQVLNSSGKFVCFIGGWGIKPGQLFRPKGVVTFEDRVFVTDSYLGRIQVFNMRGDFLGMLADSNGAPIKLTTPMGITIDAERRRLYVVELKADRVCRMDLE
jgi:DNA-binding beta-propeller fold protein YncE